MESEVPFTQQELSEHREMRDWLYGFVKNDPANTFDQIVGKLSLITIIIEQIDANDDWSLKALGLNFGDAIAQQMGMEWAMFEGDGQRLPELVLPGTTVRLRAFTALQKRVQNGDVVNVAELFDALCQQVEHGMLSDQRKGSFFSRLFKRQ